MPASEPSRDPRRILVVEETPFFLNVTHRRLETQLNVTVLDAGTLAEARAVIEREGPSLFLCVVDLVLPDADSGDIVDLAIENGLPCIVFTSMFSDEVREEVLSKKVIDYVTKDSPASLDYMTHLITRLVGNAETKVLVVDDSRSARSYVCDLLHLYRFQVLEAADGVQALSILRETPDIRLIVTDYFMPRMDGFELVKQVRNIFAPTDVAIIGLSSAGSGLLSARFIKYGANDVLNKPFLREEFFCRISQNMDNLDYIRDLEHAAQFDPLTDLYNRRFLFEAAEPFLSQARREGSNPVVAMMDIDHFKSVNDTFGHDAGDAILVGIAETLRRLLRRRSDILARVGGEEFCLFAPELAPEAVEGFFEKLRNAVADMPIALADNDSRKSIKITMSIGVCDRPMASFNEMLRRADRCLYAAKAAGRNCVRIESRNPHPASIPLSGARLHPPVTQKCD
ncbi:diguanylate cyclase [Roseospira marina]|uniref:diguanylate cyclase n=2 Tax=Roseospira marina TaxID=140057 RepID=A0A5M6IFV5_9PROT|nr:diguanylate cyclase [Roseospira marina]KAA5607176.1 diguanylate cyclase [Roseospira marina]MBB4312674.1 diguanylate cyclase (GGDEF)-like protein [Roseospira marina]MBB5086553.1 diguanylate cyclase (GGDEF)-like protein [Roseospira marina]